MWRAQRNSFRTKPRLGATLDRGHSLSRGLRAFWLLNEGYGDAPRDLVNGQTATFTNSPSWTGGRFGAHAILTGGTSYLNAGNPAAVDFTTGTGFTCSFAARCDTVPNFADGMIASKGSEWFVAFNGPSTGLRFVLAGGGGAGGVVSESRSIAVGEYSIWSVTYNRTSKAGNIYRDGALVATATLSAFGDFPTSTSNLSFGSAAGSSPWAGAIDWIQFHDRDLGAGEIAFLHAQPFANLVTADSLFNFLGEAAASGSATTISASTTLGFTASAGVSFGNSIAATTTLGFTAAASVGFGNSIVATTTLGFSAAASVTFTTATTIAATTTLGFTAAASVTFTTSALTISAATTLGFTAAATVTLTTATTISASTTLGFTAAAVVAFASSNLTIAASTSLGFTAAANVAFTTATTIAVSTTLGFTASAQVAFTAPTTIAAATTLGFTASAVVAFTGGTVDYYASELEAIAAYWDASPTLNASVPNQKLWFYEAPEGTVLPYVTYMLVSRVPTVSSGDLEMISTTIQFSIHDRLPTLCESIANKLRTVFNKAIFPIGNQYSRPMIRRGEGVFKAEGKAPGGKDCWMQTIDYELVHYGPSPSGV